MVGHFGIHWDCLETREEGGLVREEGRERGRELRNGRGGKVPENAGEVGSMRCLTAATGEVWSQACAGNS